MTFQAQVVYWHGENIEHSEPIFDSSPEFATRGEAEAWGQSHVNTASPWPGRDYEDHYEVTQYEVVDIDAEGLSVEEAVHRWIYDSGRLDDELSGSDA